MAPGCPEPAHCQPDPPHELPVSILLAGGSVAPTRLLWPRSRSGVRAPWHTRRMAEEPGSTKPGDGIASKLGLPKLGFRRGRKQGEAAEERVAETGAETHVEAEAP